MGDNVPEAVEVRTTEVQQVAGVLAERSRLIGGAASGLDRGIPPVPEDEHGLAGAFIGLDEARERAERRTADVLGSAAARLDLLALRAITIDTNSPFPHLPAIGR
jgi:hypothetical protein